MKTASNRLPTEEEKQASRIKTIRDLIVRLDDLELGRQYGTTERPFRTTSSDHADEAFSAILAGSWGIIRDALEEKANRG